ncbi:PglD-related sugar-binding protein [Alkaliphilus crotonatoxidans]
MRLAIFGGGGLGRETADIALDLGYSQIVFIDQGVKREYNQFPEVSEASLYDLLGWGYQFIIGIGSPQIRQQIWARYPRLPYVNLIHPGASFGYGQLEALNRKVGNVVFPGVRMTNGIEVGSFGIYYMNCTIAHDCVIKDFVTLCPGVNISGNVRVSMGAYVGANACILQGSSLHSKRIIGKFSIVGAGALVTKDVADHTIVKGIPAKQ